MTLLHVVAWLPVSNRDDRCLFSCHTHVSWLQPFFLYLSFKGKKSNLYLAGITFVRLLLLLPHLKHVIVIYLFAYNNTTTITDLLAKWQNPLSLTPFILSRLLSKVDRGKVELN